MESELGGNNRHRSVVYFLADPTDPRLSPRYVGLSEKPQDRLSGHIRSAKINRLPVQKWVAGLLARGVRPSLHVVMNGACGRDETTAIKTLRAAGFDLLNVNTGPGYWLGRKRGLDGKEITR